MITLTEAIYHVELVDGKEIQKPLPKKLHFLIERYLILILSRELPKQYLAGPELNVLTGGKTSDERREYIIPDIVVLDRSARYEDGDLAEPPIWGVEILSPGQTIGDLFTRAERLLKIGTAIVWVIWPEKRRAWELTSNDLREVHEELTGLLPQQGGAGYVKVSLSEMWAELD